MKQNRIISFILFILLIFTAFSGCGGKEEEPKINPVKAFKEKLISLPENYKIGSENRSLAVYEDRIYADVEITLTNDKARNIQNRALFHGQKRARISRKRSALP